MVDWKVVNRNMSKVLVDKDFFLFRPCKLYRTNANIILLRTNPMVFIDAGTKNNPPVRHIQQIIYRFQIDPGAIRYIIISHDHQDHCQNLPQLQQIAPKALTICSKGDLLSLRFPFLMPPTWYGGLYYYGMKRWGIYTYGVIYALFSNVFWRTIQKANRIDAYITEEATIQLGNDWIRIFPLRGHSRGHICVLDSRKNLFVGDFVPFTPWIEPTQEGIDLILGALERILKFTDEDVHRVIRAHGDIRRPNPQQWEIDSWTEEKKRFQFFYDTILKTLEIIPKRIKGKFVTIHQLTSLFAPHYLKYSRLMRTIFIPPAITWGIAYALKLKAEGKIYAVKRNGRFFWTA
jgi:glyoxylase-like metal-dependent hydrolase (beta-lactamase superfamily II)